MEKTHEELAREGLVRVGKALAAAGLNTGISGNMSVRLGDLRMVTPAGTDKARIVPSDMILVDALGQPRSSGKISSETPLHLMVYDVAPHAGAVVHAHPPNATVVGLLDEVVNLCVTAEGAAFLGPVALVPYVRPGTQDLAKAIGEAAKISSTILMRHHGALTIGPDIDTACARMETLEHVCRIFLEARRQGCLKFLKDEEVQDLRAMFGFSRNQPVEVFDMSVVS